MAAQGQEGRVWTRDEAVSLYPAYRQERTRLLSNAACMRTCIRRYGWSDHSKKADQRQLATLRRNWAGVRQALSKEPR